MNASDPVSPAYRKTASAMAPRWAKSIEGHRQSDAAVRVLDADGRPVAGATVRIQQTSSDFDLGCNALWLGQLGDNEAAYERGLTDLFSLVTTTMCLSDIQPEPGVWRFAEGGPDVFRRPRPDRALRFAREHGLKLKGQSLLADSWFPPWAAGWDAERVRALYRDFFRRVAERYGDYLDFIDLTNESFLCHRRRPDFPLYTPELDYVDWAFEVGAPMFPARARVCINEANPFLDDGGAHPYVEQVRRLLDRGRRVDAVGIQMHLDADRMEKTTLSDKDRFSLENVERSVARFAELGVPVYISEITIPAAVRAGREGEEIQAMVLEHFARMFYAIPGVAGITYWNLCDGRAWRNEGDRRGGLLDEFMRPKPAYHTLQSLFLREWRTAIDRPANDDGAVEFRGFHGGYRVVAEHEGKSVVSRHHLAPGGGDKPWTLRLA